MTKTNDSWRERFDKWWSERFETGTYAQGDFYDFIQSELNRRDEEIVEEFSLDWRGYCQSCLWKTELCMESPCRVRNIYNKAIEKINKLGD